MEEIFIDDEDYEKVNKYIWHKIYTDNTRFIYNKKMRSSLQNFILKGSYQKEKNNLFTKNNLTTFGNYATWGRPKSNSSSKYKGVHWAKKREKWIAQITTNGKKKHLGEFDNEDKAAEAYNKAIDKYLNGEGFKNKIGKDNRIEKRTYKNLKALKEGANDE